MKFWFHIESIFMICYQIHYIVILLHDHLDSARRIIRVLEFDFLKSIDMFNAVVFKL